MHKGTALPATNAILRELIWLLWAVRLRQLSRMSLDGEGTSPVSNMAVCVSVRLCVCVIVSLGDWLVL